MILESRGSPSRRGEDGRSSRDTIDKNGDGHKGIEDGGLEVRIVVRGGLWVVPLCKKEGPGLRVYRPRGILQKKTKWSIERVRVLCVGRVSRESQVNPSSRTVIFVV